ncbi:MAG: MarR family transcriptional regulator [Caulobacter sp.]|nr:MarR family transcriptional regulator [Caulobacter sp.]
MTDDYTREAGGAAIGARLRRLSAAFDGDATRVYAALGIAFEQRWYGVLNQIALRGPATVGELATTLRITHVSVSQTRQSLEKAGLVVTQPDDEDARRKRLALTPAGQALVDRLTPLWDVFADAALALDAEAGGLAIALDRVDDALARRSLFDRIMDRAKAP